MRFDPRWWARAHVRQLRMRVRLPSPALGDSPLADSVPGGARDSCQFGERTSCWVRSAAAISAVPGDESVDGGGVVPVGWTELPVPPGSEEVADYWSEAVRFCIDTFGPERCMFESNFPIDRETLTYPVVWNAFQIIAGDYSDSEQDQLFSGTATRAFRLA